MATLLKVNGTAEDKKSLPVGLGLQGMKEAIGGGYIEMVTLLRGEGFVLSLVIDEEGKVQSMPVNPVATAIFQRMTTSPDVICGDALLVTGYDVGLDSERWV